MIKKEKEELVINNYIQQFNNKDLGKLKLLGFNRIGYYKESKRYFFKLQCECGNIIERSNNSINQSTPNTSCGCHQSFRKVERKPKENKVVYDSKDQYWFLTKSRYQLSEEWSDRNIFKKDLEEILNKHEGIKPLDDSKPLGKDNYSIISKKEFQNSRKNCRLIEY